MGVNELFGGENMILGTGNSHKSGGTNPVGGIPQNASSGNLQQSLFEANFQLPPQDINAGGNNSSLHPSPVIAPMNMETNADRQVQNESPWLGPENMMRSANSFKQKHRGMTSTPKLETQSFQRRLPSVGS
jgi:hypothetical protein